MISDKNISNNLKLELQTLKTVLNEIGAYIYTKDINGCYTFANDLVLELFKAPLEDVIGKDDSHFFDLEISNELKKNDTRVLKYGEYIENEELNIIKATGETRIYWTVKRPLYDEKNNIIGMCGISTDITERISLEQDLKEKQYLLNTILDNIDAYVYMKDNKRTFKYVNSKVAKVFGYDNVNDIIGKRDIDVLSKDVADSFWQMDKKVFDSGEKQTAEEVFPDDEGNIRHYWSIKLPFKLDDNTNSLIGFSTDITELQILKEELRVQAITDYLTGAYNRRYFVKACENEFERTRRYNLDLSLLVLDIDWFKSVNDNYGHLVGDEVLIEIAKVCNSLKRVEDTFCRVGGEEFAIILPHTNLDSAIQLAKRISEYQNDNPVKGNFDGEINITFSIGVSSFNLNDKSYEDIFSRADDAMYEAKDTGRNRICVK